MGSPAGRDEAHHLAAVGGVLQHHLPFQWGGASVTHLFVTDEIESADAGSALLGIGQINR